MLGCGKLRVLSLMVLMICTSVSGDSGGKGRNQAFSKLTVITHNVWYGFTKVPERKNAWIEWMKAQNPDVVSLQELNQYTPQMLADDAQSYGHPHSALLKQEGFPTGITSRYPIEDIQRTLDGFHHGLMRVRIQGIYFYVIHLHPSNWEVRKAEIKKIQLDMKKLPVDSKIILAGDFNTFSPFDSVFYSHGRLEPFFNDRDIQFNEKNLNQGQLDYSVIQELMDYGLVDLENELRKSAYDFPGSFPTLVEKEGEHGDQRRLDYLFCSKNLVNNVTRAEIIANKTTLLLSDHLPVVVDITLEN